MALVPFGAVSAGLTEPMLGFLGGLFEEYIQAGWSGATDAAHFNSETARDATDWLRGNNPDFSKVPHFVKDFVKGIVAKKMRGGVRSVAGRFAGLLGGRGRRSRSRTTRKSTGYRSNSYSKRRRIAPRRGGYKKRRRARPYVVA